MLQTAVSRCSQTNHVRRQEGRDDRYGHDDGVEEFADDAQRQSQRGNDKREFTDLRHRETAAHGRLQTLATQHKRKRPQRALSDDDCQHQCQDGKCIVDEYLGVNQHTYRYEEDGSEEVFDGFHQLLNMFGFNRLCQDASHDESSES